jgi:hypothetical protein
MGRFSSAHAHEFDLLAADQEAFETDLLTVGGAWTSEGVLGGAAQFIMSLGLKFD